MRFLLFLQKKMSYKVKIAKVSLRDENNPNPALSPLHSSR